MKSIVFLLVLVAVVNGDSGKVPPQPFPSSVSPDSTTKSTTTTSPITTSKSTTVTTPTTTATTPTTTVTTPTTSTTKSTTVTTPTTSTPSPKTTTSAPNTTTVAPTTTTTAKPSPIGPPTPLEWSFNITGTNRTCLNVKMAIQMELKGSKMNINKNATVTGSCLPNLEMMNITLDNGDKLRFIFNSTVNSTKYALQRIEAEIKGINGSFIHEKPEFTTPLENSYKCSKEQSLNLTGIANTTLVVHLSNVQFQAFTNETSPKFSSAMDCEGSQTPDVVPIAVGCVLVALIVLVLVGYLFGRRRCQARGYLSMFAETKREQDYIPMKTLNCFT